MINLTRLDSNLAFPAADNALTDPNGLLAFGGDLSVARLLSAYSNGIFPWFSEGEPILWWSPDPRGVVFTEDYTSSKSLLKHIRKFSPKVTINTAFFDVINACSSVPRTDQGTWITSEMVEAYIQLHKAGFAHSVEVWSNDSLIGGLYGVYVNSVFCGESMFSLQTNASKVAFHYLVKHLTSFNIKLIDCQMQNPHLQSLGCVTISRSEFLTLLKQNANLEGLAQSDQIWTSKTLAEGV